MSFDPAEYDGVDLAKLSSDQVAAAPFYAQRHYRHATWARTYASLPELWVQPASIEEVERVVRLALRRRRRLTTTGCGHSPSDMTCTSSWLVNLDRMGRVLAMDKEQCRVTVQAGIRLRDLSAALAEHGLAMPNLGSINAQSLAGAMATGTHGSSLRHGLLSDDVESLKITLADGTTRLVTPHDSEGSALFRAALVSLGALGIVVEITMRVVPAFRLRWTQTVDADKVAFAAWRDSNRLWTQAHFVRVWWFPYTRRAVVWAAQDATDDAEPDFVPPTSYYDGRLGYLVYHNLLYLAGWVPRILPWVEWFVFGMQYGFRNGSSSSGLQPSDKALLMNCLYSQYVNEWAIPLSRGPEALERLGAWLNRLQPGHPDYVDHRIPFSADGLYIHAPVEVRVANVPQDPVHRPRGFLSPTGFSDAQGEPTLYLNAIMYRPYLTDPPGTDRYYEAFEWLMRDLGGRPHWAKNFGSSQPELKASYGPDFDRFLAVRNRVDPDGLFVGPWHRRYLLGDEAPLLPLEEHERQRIVDSDNSILITGSQVALKK